ncbi:hypothetical protein KQI65_12165 [bacterium]|nr:hypothetical protein [bacterium]
MRKSLNMILFLALLSPFFLSACGGGEEDSADKEEKSGLEQLADAADDMAKAAEDMATGNSEEHEPQPAVHFRKLIEYLPESFHDLEPGEAEGESATYGNWTFSQAKRRFTGPENSRVEVEIFDYAYISMLYAPFRMMFKMNLNRESTKGYERATEIAGFPAVEKWKIDTERAEATALVGDRFIVTVKSQKMPEDTPRQVLEMMNLQDLADERGEKPSA